MKRYLVPRLTEISGLLLPLLFLSGSLYALPAHAVIEKALSIGSSPISNIDMQLSIDGANSTVKTTFQSSYDRFTDITITAPATWLNRPFIEWQLAGVTYSANASINFSLDDDMVLTAVYGAPHFTLTVPSSPDTVIRTLNEDLVEFFTPFVRNFDYESPYEAIVRAPETYNNRPFSRWLLDGKPSDTFHVAYITMDKNHTLEAQYGEGSIVCKLNPKSARKAGARWRVDGGPWLKAGAKVEHLSIGDHILEFKPTTGFKTPKSRAIPVVADTNRLIRSHYFEN